MNEAQTKLFGLDTPEAYQLRDFLQRVDVPFEWTCLTSDKEARQLAGVDSLADVRLPVCLLNGDTPLFNPSVRDLAQAFDWYKSPKFNEYDVAIFGAGPAGLSAAVYAASEGLRTLLIERSIVGGEAGSTSRIENYLGFPDGIPGWELASRARAQALRLGAEIIMAADGVTGYERDGRLMAVLPSGHEIAAHVTVIATGVEYRRLHLEGESELLNRGFYYGAGASEASLCEGRAVIIGGGNSAGQAALHLVNFASEIVMLVRGSSLKETLSAYLVERIEASDNIQVRTNSVAISLQGQDRVEALVYSDSCGEHRMETNQVFACIGGSPREAWADGTGLLTDSSGYILTDHDLAVDARFQKIWKEPRLPFHLECSIPGVFAAGDIRHNSTKRFATAVGEGASVIPPIFEYLQRRGLR